MCYINMMRPFYCSVDFPATVYHMSTVAVGKGDPWVVTTDFQECRWLKNEGAYSIVQNKLSHHPQNQVAQLFDVDVGDATPYWVSLQDVGILRQKITVHDRPRPRHALYERLKFPSHTTAQP